MTRLIFCFDVLCCVCASTVCLAWCASPSAKECAQIAFGVLWLFTLFYAIFAVHNIMNTDSLRLHDSVSDLLPRVYVVNFTWCKNRRTNSKHITPLSAMLSTCFTAKSSDADLLPIPMLAFQHEYSHLDQTSRSIHINLHIVRFLQREISKGLRELERSWRELEQTRH